MFRIVTIIGWTVLLILLLYIWADVREISAIVKDSKRALIRSNFGGRTAGKQQKVWLNEGFFAEEAAGEIRKERNEFSSEQGNAAPEFGQTAGGQSPFTSEEQILQEVLTEFLG